MQVLPVVHPVRAFGPRDVGDLVLLACVSLRSVKVGWWWGEVGVNEWGGDEGEGEGDWLARHSRDLRDAHPPPRGTLSLTTPRVEARGTSTSTGDEVCVAYFRVFVFMLLNVNNLEGGSLL